TMYDTQTIRPGASSIAIWSEAVGKDSHAATELHEQQLVSFLLSRGDVRSMLLDEMGLSGETFVRESVVEPFVLDRNKKPGDIDILLCDPKRPQRAVAVEVKRTKVRDDGTGSQKVTKLQGIAGGVDQAKALAEMGFGQVYLPIIVVVDGRSDALQGDNFFNRGTTRDTSEKIIEFSGWSALRPDVGILYIEVVQPVDRSILETGVIGLAIAKPAEIREQPSDTTARLVRFFGIR
ncbi:MAG TPA: hypothetical protein VFQ39_18380, partial [Longimicrobium sp.]|nr:hypothetical protein [Longimicrobium sp.]